MNGFRSFFKKYDPQLKPHEIPCSIDYPLAVPVSEELQGVCYVEEYLRRLATECKMLNRFAWRSTHLVLKCFCPGYRDMPVNLYEPVASDVIARELVRIAGFTLADEAELIIEKEELEEITEYLECLTEREIETSIGEAVTKASERLGLEDEEEEYLRMFADSLIHRIKAVRDEEGLGGIFATWIG